MSFRFINKTEPSDYATSLAHNMHKYLPAHVVAGGELFFENDLSAVSHFLTHLRPDNCLVSVSYKGFSGKTSQKERWYGTDYNERSLSETQLRQWESALAQAKAGGLDHQWAGLLHLPQPNPFIPTVFDLKAAVAAESSGKSA
jgi:insulysin